MKKKIVARFLSAGKSSNLFFASQRSFGLSKYNKKVVLLYSFEWFERVNVENVKKDVTQSQRHFHLFDANIQANYALEWYKKNYD